MTSRRSIRRNARRVLASVIVVSRVLRKHPEELGYIEIRRNLIKFDF